MIDDWSTLFIYKFIMFVDKKNRERIWEFIHITSGTKYLLHLLNCFKIFNLYLNKQKAYLWMRKTI